MTAVSAVTHSRVRSPCMSINAAASQRSTIMAGAGANLSYQFASRASDCSLLGTYLSFSPAKAGTSACRRRSVVRRPFRSGRSQMECVSSVSRHGRSTRCRTAQTQRQRSASAKRQRVRMESLERSIRQIHLPPSIGGSTRSRNSALRWKDRASSPVPAVANTPYRQRACAAPCRSPVQISFCELTSHPSLYFVVRLRD